jgi:hypothetical protein
MAHSNLHAGYGHNSRGDPNAPLNQGVALCLLKADRQRSPLAISNSARGMLPLCSAGAVERPRLFVAADRICVMQLITKGLLR